MLFLGTSERVGAAEDLFVPVNKKWRIYRPVVATRHGSVQFPLEATSNYVAEISEPAPTAPRSTLGLVVQRAPQGCLVIVRER